MSFSNAAGKCVACMHMLKLGWEWESAMTTVPAMEEAGIATTWLSGFSRAAV